MGIDGNSIAGRQIDLPTPHIYVNGVEVPGGRANNSDGYGNESDVVTYLYARKNGGSYWPVSSPATVTFAVFAIRERGYGESSSSSSQSDNSSSSSSIASHSSASSDSESSDGDGNVWTDVTEEYDLYYTFNNRTPYANPASGIQTHSEHQYKSGKYDPANPPTLHQNSTGDGTVIKVRAFKKSTGELRTEGLAANTNHVSKIAKAEINVLGGNTYGSK